MGKYGHMNNSRLGKNKCSDKKIEKLFNCMDSDYDLRLTLQELIQKKKCYKKYSKYVDVVSFFECLDSSGNVVVSLEEALENGCKCAGL